MYTLEQYRESADSIRERLGGRQPEILMILGTGLGGLGDKIKKPVYIPYGDIPNFKTATAIGHIGRFVAGELGGRQVLVMQGRLHVYEGYTMADVAYPIRVAKLLGIDKLVITNNAGGINKSFCPGDLMIITDYIKFAPGSPLAGPNIEKFGGRFPDMSRVFDKEYGDIFRAIANERGETVREGVYFYMAGPQFETPAEIRAIRALGGDAVGMSTVPEAIAANHCGMRILGLTLLTCMAAGVAGTPMDTDEVIRIAEEGAGRFEAMMTEFVRRI